MLTQTSQEYMNLLKNKKRLYNVRITEIEKGKFSPLIMSPTGGIGQECKKFYSRSAEMISSKKGTGYNIVVAWIRRQITFPLIKSSSNMVYRVRTWYLHTALLKIQGRFRIKNAN